MPTFFGARAKDFMRCLKNIHKFADGQASLLRYSSDTLDSLTVLLSPNSGLYKGGHFAFDIRLPDQYPKEPPQVTCLTNIYHPNINMDSEAGYNVCLSLFDDWCEGKFGLEDTINGLLFLLYYPNVDDPWASFFSGNTSERRLRRNIQRSLAGMEVKDVDGEPIDMNFEKFIEYNAAEYDYDETDEENSDHDEECNSDIDEINTNSDVQQVDEDGIPEQNENSEESRIEADHVAEEDVNNAVSADVVAQEDASNAVSADVVAGEDVSNAVSADVVAQEDASNAVSADVVAQEDASNAVSADVLAEEDVSNAVSADVVAEEDVSNAVSADGNVSIVTASTTEAEEKKETEESTNAELHSPVDESANSHPLVVCDAADVNAGSTDKVNEDEAGQIDTLSKTEIPGPKKNVLDIDAVLRELNCVYEKLKPDDVRSLASDEELFSEEEDATIDEEMAADEVEDEVNEVVVEDNETHDADVAELGVVGSVTVSLSKTTTSLSSEASDVRMGSASTSKAEMSRRDTLPVEEVSQATNSISRSLTVNPTRTQSKRCLDLRTLYTVAANHCLSGAVAMSRLDTKECWQLQRAATSEKRRHSHSGVDASSSQPKRRRTSSHHGDK